MNVALIHEVMTFLGAVGGVNNIVEILEHAPFPIHWFINSCPQQEL